MYKMNICFAITDKYEYEFTSNNLIKCDMMLESIRIVASPGCSASPADENVLGTVILLDAVNNMQERRQSPLVVVNETYQSNRLNVVVPKVRKWRFYLTDKEGNYIHIDYPIRVSISFHLVNE